MGGDGILASHLLEGLGMYVDILGGDFAAHPRLIPVEGFAAAFNETVDFGSARLTMGCG
jgi:hypothetical protein